MYLLTSLGNPHIISVASVRPGTFLSRKSATWRNSSTVYSWYITLFYLIVELLFFTHHFSNNDNNKPLFIASNTELLPACTGTWRNENTLWWFNISIERGKNANTNRKIKKNILYIVVTKE